MGYEALAVVYEEEPIEKTTFFLYISLIIWSELILVSARRTLWVLIRVENEFFTSYEQFRDIITVPPIKKEA